MEKRIEKNYSVAIDTVPLPEEPAERIDVVMKSFGPVFIQMIRDAMVIAIGSRPTPERPDIP